MCSAGGWQPIESAPKDEDAEFLVAGPFGAAVASRSFFDEREWIVSVGGKYVYDSGEDIVRVEPTHWMPLSEIPRPAP